MVLVSWGWVVQTPRLSGAMDRRESGLENRKVRGRNWAECVQNPLFFKQNLSQGVAELFISTHLIGPLASRQNSRKPLVLRSNRGPNRQIGDSAPPKSTEKAP